MENHTKRIRKARRQGLTALGTELEPERRVPLRASSPAATRSSRLRRKAPTKPVVARRK